MIRALRRRFIFSAMAAFAILLVLLISGLGISSYLRIESSSEIMMEEILSDNKNPDKIHAPRPNPMPDMGFIRGQARQYIAHYIVTVSPDGEIAEVEEKGIWEPNQEAAGEYALQALQTGYESGKINSFKYRIRNMEDGSARIILLDNSMQLHMLAGMLESAGLISLACLVLLFFILLPISTRVVRSYALHIKKQKQFITNAGHEIKTPVAIILSNIDAMELIQGENKWSRNIRSQTDRLSVLLQRLLFMSRIDEKSMVLPMRVLELNAIVQAELDTYNPILTERNLALHRNLPGEIRLKGNREYLQQMIHMLLDNAVQYANEGGNIRISEERKRRRIRLLFENTVESLPDCPPENLFDRFYRGDSARTQSSGGYGIGLSAARAIAEMHQGKITAEYIDENIIRFAVELPG